MPPVLKGTQDSGSGIRETLPAHDSKMLQQYLLKVLLSISKINTSVTKYVIHVRVHISFFLSALFNDSVNCQNCISSVNK
jgi:hypothetical protein